MFKLVFGLATYVVKVKLSLNTVIKISHFNYIFDTCSRAKNRNDL